MITPPSVTLGFAVRVTVVVSMVSVIWVTAGVVSGVTTRPPPPVVPVMVAEISVPSRYTVSFGGMVTLTLPVVWPALMMMIWPLDRVTVRSVSGGWPRVAL
ncbi:hypothetical protein D3C77_475990 [compost metagenome]